ncbi:hypothetical protein Tco_1106487 [Tanacetum coccineum]
MGELPPITVSTFTARIPENTPLTNHASTSANPDPLISPSFVEANYEEYDEEREIEPRPARDRDTTPVLQTGSPHAWRQRGRVIDLKMLCTGIRAGLKGNPRVEGLRNEEHEMVGVMEGHQPSTNSGGNLPPNSTHLSHNAPPLIPNTLQPSNGHMPTYVNPYSQPNASMTYDQPSSYSFHAQGSLFADSTGCVTPFIRWIEDYPLLEGLKMPSYVGSYDGKGDPDNYLHLFKGVIRMHKWAMPIACHMFTYTLKDSGWICKGKKKNRDMFSPYKGSNHGFLSNLSNSPREIQATEKAAKAFEQPSRIVETLDRRSCKVRAAWPSCERNNEKKGEGLIYSIGRMKEERQGYCTSRSPYPHGKKGEPYIEKEVRGRAC